MEAAKVFDQEEVELWSQLSRESHRDALNRATGMVCRGRGLSFRAFFLHIAQDLSTADTSEINATFLELQLRDC